MIAFNVVVSVSPVEIAFEGASGALVSAYDFVLVKFLFYHGNYKNQISPPIFIGSLNIT